MSEHFIVALDQGHLRIYAERRAPEQFTPGLEQVEAMDFPLGRRSYAENDAAMAGRFPTVRGRHPTSSIDERLPMKVETNRRRAQELAQEVDRFFVSRPAASWDFAAAPELHRVVLEQLTPATRRRLRRAVPKDLVNQPPHELIAQFAGQPR